MKLFSFPLSPPSQLSVAVARHLGLPLEEIDVNIPLGESHTDDYKTKNPIGKVPTLIDEDLTLFES